jgi:hypothetical protein
MTGLPLSATALLLFLGFVTAAEIGFAVHRRVNARPGESNDESQVLSTALLLLALLLGFTFSMALGRYDERRQLVVTEANAIGTAWLRAGLVDGPAGTALQAGLGDYARARLALADAGEDAARIAAAEARAAALRGVIWQRAAAATAPIRTTAQAAALIEAINTVIDSAAVRANALESHVPDRVISLLIVYAGVAALLLGYVLGATGVHHRIATSLLFALLATTIMLVLDLDRPRSGAIQVSQAAMRDLVADLGRQGENGK